MQMVPMVLSYTPKTSIGISQRRGNGGVLVVRVSVRMRIAVSCLRARMPLLLARMRAAVLALPSRAKKKCNTQA